VSISSFAGGAGRIRGAPREENFTVSVDRQPVDRLLRARVLASLSPSRKIELAEKESREILALQPDYALIYLKRKLAPPFHQ
jgi:hypothetical protein